MCAQLPIRGALAKERDCLQAPCESACLWGAHIRMRNNPVRASRGGFRPLVKRNTFNYRKQFSSPLPLPVGSKLATIITTAGQNSKSADNNERRSASADNKRRAARGPPFCVAGGGSLLPGPTKEPVGVVMSRRTTRSRSWKFCVVNEWLGWAWGFHFLSKTSSYQKCKPGSECQASPLLILNGSAVCSYREGVRG